MNKVILMGRLTKDPEVRWSGGENSSAVARFTLAVDRKFKRDGEPTADFPNCVAFGKQAEFCEKYLKQGCSTSIGLREGSGLRRSIPRAMCRTGSTSGFTRRKPVTS